MGCWWSLWLSCPWSPQLKGCVSLVSPLSVLWSCSLFFPMEWPCSYRHLINPIVFVCAVIPFFTHLTHVWGCKYRGFLREFVLCVGEREKWVLKAGTAAGIATCELVHRRSAWMQGKFFGNLLFPNPSVHVLCVWGWHGHLPPYKHCVGLQRGGTRPLSCGCCWGSSCPVFKKGSLKGLFPR